jgi:uncharacterized protein YqgC (DUF456 family)
VTIDLLVGLVMLVGLVGIVIPFLPGLPLIVVAAFVWVLAGGTDTGQWVVFIIVAAISVAAMVVGSALPARRASGAGASGWVLAAGAVGLVVGAFVIPIVGALIGWPVGVFAAELLRTRHVPTALATTRATLVGMGTGIAIQLGGGVVAVGVWGVAAWRW